MNVVRVRHLRQAERQTKKPRPPRNYNGWADALQTQTHYLRRRRMSPIGTCDWTKWAIKTSVNQSRRPTMGGEQVTQAMLLRMAEQQAYRCAYTGDELTPQTVSVDHIKPVSDGGRHTVANLQLVRHDVNRAKGSMSHEDFVAMCVAVANKHGKKRKRKRNG